MRKARILSVALAAAFSLSSTGCVGIVYAVKANAAASKLEQAKTLNADELAEYEYYYAKEMLLKAQEEAALASYGDAIDLADISEDFADKAIELARDAHQGAGR
jgi:hypothetical protein